MYETFAAVMVGTCGVLGYLVRFPFPNLTRVLEEVSLTDFVVAEPGER